MYKLEITMVLFNVQTGCHNAFIQCINWTPWWFYSIWIQWTPWWFYSMYIFSETGSEMNSREAATPAHKKPIKKQSLSLSLSLYIYIYIMIHTIYNMQYILTIQYVPLFCFATISTTTTTQDVPLDGMLISQQSDIFH